MLSSCNTHGLHEHGRSGGPAGFRDSHFDLEQITQSNESVPVTGKEGGWEGLANSPRSSVVGLAELEPHGAAMVQDGAGMWACSQS